MQYLPAFVIVSATLGVSALCLAPQPHDDIFGAFDPDISNSQILNRVKGFDLEVVSFDPKLNHVIVSNPKGDAPNRLKRAGATFVIKSKFAQFCSGAKALPQKMSTQ